MYQIFKEYKKIIKSSIYFLFILFLFIIYFTQYFTQGDISNKNKDTVTFPYLISEYIKNDGQTQCGNANTMNEKIIINRSVFSLYNEFKQNSYTSFSKSGYKEINLNPKDSNKIKELIEKITNIKIGDFKSQDINEMLCNIDIGYKDFKKLMEKADKIIGKNSNYSKYNLEDFAVMNLSYEELLEKDENFPKDKNLINIYSKQFIKSINKSMQLLPIIFITLLFIKNKKQYLNNETKDSLKDIMIKYLAIILAIMTSVFLLILISILQFILNSNTYIYYFVYTFFKGTIIYILPTVIFSTAIGFLVVYLYATLIKSSNKGKHFEK